MIKQLAVIPVLVNVRRSDFLSIRQDLTENTRSFACRLKEKPVHDLTPVLAQTMVDFTDIILNNVVMTGLAEKDICKEC